MYLFRKSLPAGDESEEPHHYTEEEEVQQQVPTGSEQLNDTNDDDSNDDQDSAAAVVTQQDEATEGADASISSSRSAGHGDDVDDGEEADLSKDQPDDTDAEAAPQQSIADVCHEAAEDAPAEAIPTAPQDVFPMNLRFQNCATAPAPTASGRPNGRADLESPSSVSQIRRSSNTGISPRATAGITPANSSTMPAMMVHGGASMATPRSSSRLRSTSAFSHGASTTPEEAANRHYLHCASVVSAARQRSARRASGIHGVVGPLDGGAGRHAPLSEGEAVAMERMMFNEFRVQEARDRAAQMGVQREAFIIESELEKEKQAYERRADLEAEMQRRCARSSEDRRMRTEIAAERRHQLEQERQQLLADKNTRNDQRVRDPYATLMAKRRFSSPNLRQSAPIRPQRPSTGATAAMAAEQKQPGAETNGMGRFKFPEDWESRRGSAHQANGSGAPATPRRVMSPKSWRSHSALVHRRSWH